MKLSAPQALNVAEQLDAQPLFDDHPNFAQLKETFGDHTFFLNAQGLLVVQTPDDEEKRVVNDDGSEAALVISIGEWSAEEEGMLQLHQPRATQQTVGVIGDEPGQAS
jgi:hypothetical protein